MKNSIILLILALVILPACTVGPDYQRPKNPATVAFKELKGWKQAQPSDCEIPNAWWALFKDPYLNKLAAQVQVNNQSLVQAEAQFRQAQDLVQGARSAYFPTATATATTNRFRAATGQSVAVSGVRSLFGMAVSVAWEPDLWGSVRRQVEANQATAQASFATLQALRLSAQATLAQSYFQLRALDAQKKILDDTVATYSKTLQITQNRYAVGVSAKSELVQAKAQLEAVRAQAINISVQRAKLEHAIALLMGKTPTELSIPEAPLPMQLPDIPVSIASDLLERRPDVAMAERQVAAANAKIGVAKAAYFPTVNLSANNGYQSSTLSNLANSAARYWALGPAAFALPLFDGGAKGAQMSEAIHTFDASVAAYRQAVLTGFQEVEDNLAALRILEQEIQVQSNAVALTQEALNLTTNQFQAGTVSYLDVMLAQVTALDNQKAAIALQGQRFDASVLLIKALGGGWTTKQMPSADKVGGEPEWSQFLPIPLH